MVRNRTWGQMILVPKDPCPRSNMNLKLLKNFHKRDYTVYEEFYSKDMRNSTANMRREVP